MRKNEKITALYERLSRDDFGKDDDQQRESNSISNQKAMLEEFAARQGFTNIVHFTDDGISGTCFDRPGFLAMMKEVEAGNVEYLCIKDMSRMGRDYLKVGQIMEILRQRGVRLIAINDGVDSARGDDDFTPFRNIMNEYYARDTSRKIRSTFQSKGKSGKHLTGTVIYGYLWNEARDQWLVDPEAAEVVKRIFAMTIEGYGPYQIASKLKEEKILIPSAYLAQHGEGVNKNKTFKDVYGWGSSTICNLLEKREYLGHTINFKTRKHFKDKKSHYVPEDEWTIFENTHEAIIDQQTFDLVQKIRGNVRRYPDGWGEAAPLTGLLYCADCGGKMELYKAIKYIRLSYTDDKTVESDSVANQRRLIDDFVEKHPEIEVVAEKIDDGYSGVLFDRPAFQEMMDMIKQGEANCVIVKDLSRLGREYIETGRYMRRVFPAYGVRFIAINDNVDTVNDAVDYLTVSVKNIMNEAYCRDISVKTRSALEAKRRSGDFVGAFPVYGYFKTGEKHKSLEVDPYAADVVRDIFRKRLDGFSALHIAEELNRLGVLSPLAYKRNNGLPHAKGGYTDRKDCKWSATTVIRILQDETYTGTLVQGRQATPHFKLKELENKPSSEWVRVAGAHEAIISKHDFDLVQRIRRIDTRTSPKEDKVYLFSGILICGCCGGRMTRKINRYKDKVYVYYFCPSGKKNGCASGAMVKESDLIQCVQDSLKGHIDNIASLDTMLSSISQERINRELAREYAGQIGSCEKQLAQIEKYKAKLYENLVSGILTKEEFLSYKRKYNADIEGLQAAIESWNEKLTDVLENRSERNRWINHFMKFSEMEEIDRRAVMQLIRSIRIISKEELQIEFNYQDEYQKAVRFAEQMEQAKREERRAG